MNKIDYCIEVAQKRDEAAQSSGRRYYAEDRDKAFEVRKRARQLKHSGVYPMTKGSVDSALSVLRQLQQYDGPLSSAEAAVLEKAESKIEEVKLIADK